MSLRFNLLGEIIELALRPPAQREPKLARGVLRML
jgi:hypothetical protein